MQWPERCLVRMVLAAAMLLSLPVDAGGFGTGKASAENRSTEERSEALSAKVSKRADQNWHYFWDHHLGKWEGRWTRYTSAGTVVETFRSSRDFQADPSHTEIHQVNRYRYDDGRTVEKSWSFNRAEHSQADGFSHPASTVMRGLAFVTEPRPGWCRPWPQRLPCPWSCS